MDVVARLSATTRRALRVALLSLLAAWVLDLPGRIGLALYTEQFLSLALGLAVALALLQPRGNRCAAAWRDLLLAAVLLTVFALVAVRYPQLQASMVPATPLATALCVAMLAGALEAIRRRLGAFLPLLVLGLCGLVLVGSSLPAGLELRPLAAGRLVVYLGLDSNALLGRILAIASTVVAPFIVFGVLFGAVGGSERLAGLAARLVGRRRGGAAKVSVAGSAVFGLVSGSAVANVVSVGSVSIPLMVRAGYPRHLAAAVEAIGSTGGQLLPPIMGASAFLMAEFLEIPYRRVVGAALLPALMFYAALWLAVEFEARRSGRTWSARPAAGSAPAAGRGLLLLVPVALLLWLLFAAGWTPELAAAAGVGGLLVAALPGSGTHVRERLGRALGALTAAMEPVADIVLIGAAAGLVIGTLDLSGLSFALTLRALELGGGSLPALLAATGALSLMLGLGMPTVGVYALLATLAAPALVALSVQPLAAHLYVLYFGMFSMITPPIALASFAAASVAHADPWRTAFASLRFGAGLYLVPVAFVLQPELLLSGALPDILLAALRLLLAVTLATAAALGHAGRRLCPRTRLLAAALAVVDVLPWDTFAAVPVAPLALAGSVALVWALLPIRATRA